MHRTQICWATAAMIPILASGVAQGLLPALVACERSNNILRRNQLARLGSEVAAISSVPIAFELALNGENIFLLLTNRYPTDFPASVVMACFATGFLINATICIPVTLQIALKDLRRTTRVALATSAIVPFALFVLYSTVGVSGASLCWPLANAMYFVSILVWHQRRFGTAVDWLKACVAQPLFYGFVFWTVGSKLTQQAPQFSQHGEIAIVIRLALCAVGCAIPAAELRSYIYLRLRSCFFVTEGA
jgi:O-antigen/teichoic acid export membrane protein